MRILLSLSTRVEEIWPLGDLRKMYVKTTRPEPAVSKLRPVSPDAVLGEFSAISIKHEPLWSGSRGRGSRRRIHEGSETGDYRV
jgi:hypothetical protein